MTNKQWYHYTRCIAVTHVRLLFDRPFAKRFALCYRSVVCLSCPVCLWRWCTVAKRKMKLGMQVGLGPCHIVLDMTQFPLPQRGTAVTAQPQIFGPCLLLPNGWMDQDVTWHGGTPRPRTYCARWRPSSLPKKGHSLPPGIFGHVCCGQTAGWSKMSLGTMVGLGPGHIVLHGDPARPPKMVGLYCPLQYSAHVYCDQRVVHLSYCWALVFKSHGSWKETLL